MVLKVDQLPGKQGRRLQLCQCWLIIQVMVRNRGQIDTTIEIITPENIAFRYRVAGPFRRLPAYLIDLAIRLTLAFGGMFLLSFAFGMIGWGGIGIGLGLILWFVLAWFYGGLFEAFWNGQTPGKRLLQIRVLAVDGRPINALQAVLRNILRAIDSAPPLVFFGQPIWFLGTYLVGLVAAATNNRFQRLGDLVCGTMVVLEERSMRLPALARADLPAVRKLEGLIPPSFQPDRSLSRTFGIAARNESRSSALCTVRAGLYGPQGPVGRRPPDAVCRRAGGRAAARGGCFRNVAAGRRGAESVAARRPGVRCVVAGVILADAGRRYPA